MSSKAFSASTLKKKPHFLLHEVAGELAALSRVLSCMLPHQVLLSMPQDCAESSKDKLQLLLAFSAALPHGLIQFTSVLPVVVS